MLCKYCQKRKAHMNYIYCSKPECRAEHRKAMGREETICGVGVRPVGISIKDWNKHLDELSEFYAKQEAKLIAACKTTSIKAYQADLILNK